MTTVLVTVRETNNLVLLTEAFVKLADSWHLDSFDFWQSDDDESEWSFDAIVRLTADRDQSGIAAVAEELNQLVLEGWIVRYIESDHPTYDTEEPVIKEDDGIKINPDAVQKLINTPNTEFKQQTIDLSSGPVQVNIPGVGWGVVSGSLEDFQNLLKGQTGV